MPVILNRCSVFTVVQYRLRQKGQKTFRFRKDPLILSANKMEVIIYGTTSAWGLHQIRDPPQVLEVVKEVLHRGADKPRDLLSKSYTWISQ